MRKNLSPLSALAMALFLTAHLVHAMTLTNSATGLWVGEVVLQNVNETVSGVKADNSVYSPNPAVPTPVQVPAHIRVIFHVNASGQVNLLKGVAIVSRLTNGTPDFSGTNSALLSDPALYQNYGSNPGSRITAVAFDFGDPSGEQALNVIASNAAITAVSNPQGAIAAATTAQSYLQGNVPTNATAAYSAFVNSSLFQNSAVLAGTAATNSLVGAGSDTAAMKFQIANAAALTALLNANIFTKADALTLDKVPLTGSVSPGGTLTGTIYLGADHPTNPFRHKWNPIHQHGYAITRQLTVSFDSAASSNAVNVAGFGVNALTGTYQEQIFGLHKPLGPNQDIGLITTGPIKLNRISLIGVLNQ